MMHTLHKIGIFTLEEAIHVFEIGLIEWINSEDAQLLDIQIFDEPEHTTSLSIICSPQREGIAERTFLFHTIIAGFKFERSLVAETLLNQINPSHNYVYSEENEAFVIPSHEETIVLLNQIIDLFQLERPSYVLKEPFDDEELDDAYELGLTLHHLIAMMSLNQEQLTLDNIKHNINLSLELEGQDYIQDLKMDISNQHTFDFIEEFNVTAEEMNRIKTVILTYTNH